jgi:predicted nucleotidyltransferase
MEMEKQKSLEERNSRIIRAVISKIEKLCPGSVDLIGIAGSFCTGDIHEKSDLDLLIVINDDKAWSIACGFILEDVGFDIYCSKWDRLENMAEYNNPYVGKLIDLKIVYVLNKESENRYYELQRKLLEKLNAPLSAEDYQKAKGFLRQAETEYVGVMANDDISTCRYSSALLLYYVEFSVYMINKKYVKYGIKRIPQEMSGMQALPERFMELHGKIVRCENVSEIKASCTELIKVMRKFIKDHDIDAKEKKDMTAKDLAGTYEEIYSNWRSKMYHSIDIDNPYLSFSTISSCQNFYNEVFGDFNVEHIDVIKDFYPSDLSLTAACFDRAMEEYLKLYGKLGIEVANYAAIEDFEKSYLA